MHFPLPEKVERTEASLPGQCGSLRFIESSALCVSHDVWSVLLFPPPNTGLIVKVSDEHVGWPACGVFKCFSEEKEGRSVIKLTKVAFGRGYACICTWLESNTPN